MFFTTMVYSKDVITGAEAVAKHQRLALLLSNKLKPEYLDMCGFKRDQMSLVIMRYNTLLLLGTSYKEAYIRKRPNM